MFIREIDALLKKHDPKWRVGIFVIFLIACVQSVAVVVRPLPINALIEGPKPDTWWGGIEAALLRDFDRIWLYVGLIFAIEFVVLAFFLLSEYRTSALSERIIRSIRGSIALNLLRGPYARLSKMGAGGVLAAASGDLEAVQRLLREALVHAGVAVLQLVLMLCVIFFVEKWLFYILLAEIGVLVCAIAYYAQWRKKKYIEKMALDQGYLGYLASLYQKNLDLRFTGLGAAFIVRLLAGARKLASMNRMLWRRHGAYHGLVEFVIGMSSAVCLVLLFVTTDGTPQIGKFLIFAYYTMLIFPNLSRIGEAWPMINDARLALKRISASTEGLDGVLAEKGARPPAAFGEIRFENVTLVSDRGETLLHPFSLSIRPGEKIGLFGDSGSGKTTLIFMLLGMHRPSSGRITLDGRDVTSLSLADRKRLFFFARAATAFVHGTVADNVAIHRTLADDLWARTLERVKMDRRVEAEPEGLKAPVGDKGEPFSGGEQQRLAFARALLTDAPCLILDETLASLDEETEMFMLGRLIEDFPDKTLICVSHRKQVGTLFGKRIMVRRGGHVSVTEGSIGENA
ncbi:MAG: ABC transporter ATP-binding protein [Rhodospirillales bacterium]|nr:ABC transporter ATP-binding protein [Rhodospirillales bacterium]